MVVNSPEFPDPEYFSYFSKNTGVKNIINFVTIFNHIEAHIISIVLGATKVSRNRGGSSGFLLDKLYRCS